MYRIKGLATLLILLCVVCSSLCGCAFKLTETRSFSAEELASYNAPIVFLGSSNGRYFITLDNPQERYSLNYRRIWDSDSVGKTFLYSMETDGKEEIHEYDFIKKTSQCILGEDFVCDCLNLEEDSKFESVYYYPADHTISFLYGDILCIYDSCKEEIIYKRPLNIVYLEETVYDWRTPQIFLMRTGNAGEIYEVNIYTEEKVKVSDDKSMGFGLILTDDKSMGCSYGDENWFGVSFSPVLVWDTEGYKVKRFREGVMSGCKLQLSNDKKYVMFVRNNGNEANQVLCLKVEDETMCEVYETENWIYDILWW